MTKRLNWWDFAHKKEPDIRLLERILHSDDCDLYNRDQIKAIRLKYQALNAKPTIIEKTMSPLQLFEAGNPLWTTIFTGYQVYNIITAPSPTDAILVQQKSNERK